MWRDNPIFHRIGGKYYRRAKRIPLILRMLPSYIFMGMIGVFFADLSVLSLILSLGGLMGFMLLVLMPREVVLIIHSQRQPPMIDNLMVTPLTRFDMLWGYFSGAIRRYAKDTGIPFIALAAVITGSLLPIMVVVPQTASYAALWIGSVGLFLLGVSLAILMAIVNRSAVLAVAVTTTLFVVLVLVWVVAMLLIFDSTRSVAIYVLIIANTLPFLIAGVLLIPSYVFVRGW